MKYYRRYVGDYMRDTQDLSPLEHGFYSMLLDIYYATEKPLPASLDALGRMCKVTNRSQKRSLGEIANRFFPLNGDGLRHNPRADKEILTAQEAISKMKASGHVGANRRWHREPHSPPHSPPNRVPIEPPAFNPKDVNRDSPTRADEIQNPLKKMLKEPQQPDEKSIEKHKRIAAALASGNTDLANAIRDGTT